MAARAATSGHDQLQAARPSTYQGHTHATVIIAPFSVIWGREITENGATIMAGKIHIEKHAKIGAEIRVFLNTNHDDRQDRAAPRSQKSGARPGRRWLPYSDERGADDRSPVAILHGSGRLPRRRR